MLTSSKWRFFDQCRTIVQIKIQTQNPTTSFHSIYPTKTVTAVHLRTFCWCAIYVCLFTFRMGLRFRLSCLLAGSRIGAVIWEGPRELSCRKVRVQPVRYVFNLEQYLLCLYYCFVLVYVYYRNRNEPHRNHFIKDYNERCIWVFRLLTINPWVCFDLEWVVRLSAGDNKWCNICILQNAKKKYIKWYYLCLHLAYRIHKP